MSSRSDMLASTRVAGKRTLFTWARALGTIALVTALVILPAAWYGAILPLKQEVGFDVHFAYAPAAHEILEGANPYPVDLDSAEVLDEHAYAYPPLLAFATLPLTVVTDTTAGYVGAALSLLAVAAILLVLGIRDWRCYGAALAWAPTYNAVQNANISLLVALGLALAWRWRERIWQPGAALGVAIALKVFAAPLLLWPLAMRRTRAALVGAVVAAFAVLLPWAAIGFAGLADYPALLRRLGELESTQSYSAYSALVGVGVPESAATVLTLGAAIALAVACVRWGRRGDDRRSLTAAVAMVLVASPLVWQHYYTLLLVPVALAWPRLSVAWLLPIVLWTTSVAGDGNALQTLVAAATMAVVVLLCLRPALAQDRREGSVAWLPRQLTPVEAIP